GELGVLYRLAESVQLVVVDREPVGGELSKCAHVILDELVAEEELLALRLALARLAVQVRPLRLGLVALEPRGSRDVGDDELGVLRGIERRVGEVADRGEVGAARARQQREARDGDEPQGLPGSMAPHSVLPRLPRSARSSG